MLTDRQRWYREEYLESEHWRQTRARALAYAGHACQLCNGRGQLDVHHRTYERLGNEEPADLTVLCRSCHEHFHKKRPTSKPKRSKPKPPRPKKPRKNKEQSKLAHENDRLHRVQEENRRKQAAAREARVERIRVTT